MPSYKGHLSAGLFFYTIIMMFFVSRLPSPLTALEWLCFILAGSLFPDIDVKSKGQKYSYYGILLLLLVLMIQKKYYAISCISFVIITPMLVKHRGIFHRVWFVVGVCIIAWMIISTIVPSISQPLFIDMIFFLIGAIGHIACDRLQK